MTKSKINLVLFCSITGVNIKSCCKEIKLYAKANNKDIKINSLYCVEDEMANYAKNYLTQLSFNEPHTLTKILQLPYSQLLETAKSALENTLKNIYNDNKNNEKEQYVLLTLHPVLYHQSTRSFINPYSAFFFKSHFFTNSCGLT